MKKLNRVEDKSLGAQQTTPSTQNASIPTILREGSSTTEGTCVAATELPEVDLIDQGAAPVGIGVVAGASIDDDVLDQMISEKVGSIRSHRNEVRGHEEAEKVCWREVIPLLDEMQQRLTRRGARFGETFTGYLRGKGLNPNTVRSWRRRLKMESPTTAEPVETNDESTDTLNDHDWQDEREEIQTSAELAQQWANKLREVLTGPSTMSDSMRIKRADAMVADFQRALSEGNLFPALPASDPPVTASPARAAAEPRADATPAFQPTTGAYGPHRTTETSPSPHSTSMEPKRDEAEPSAHAVPAFQPKTGAHEWHGPTETLPSPRSKSIKPPKVTSGAPVTGADGEDRGNRVLPDATDYVPSVITQAHWARTESGKWEYVGKDD